MTGSPLFFAAGDVGGARSAAAVMAAAIGQGRVCHVLRHGYLGTIALPDAAIGHEIGHRPPAEAAKDLLAEVAPAALVFATSVRDTVAVEFAAQAQAQAVAIPAAHLLDHWTAYRARMRLPDGQYLAPRLYAVADEFARDTALAEGIAAETLRVTGLPALAWIATAPRWRPPAAGAPLRLVFVSEPVSADQGNDPARPGYRGYTEFDVLAVLRDWLRAVDLPVTIDLLPHPREDRDRLAAAWGGAGAPGVVLSPAERDRSLAAAHGIVGMSSILLYEMWLRGFPVFSLQPGVRQESYRVISAKPGVTACENAGAAAASLDRWLRALPGYAAPDVAAAELRRHEGAAAAFLAAVDGVLNGNRRRPA